MEFKIMKGDKGYYPFVKHWFGWNRIGKEWDEFRLFKFFDHPHAEYSQAMDVINSYKEWYSNRKPVEVWSRSSNNC